MTVKIDETVKLLADEGRAKGFLTFAELNKLLENKFVPPDKMDQIFAGLENAGIELMDGEGRPANAPKRGKSSVSGKAKGKAKSKAAGKSAGKATGKAASPAAGTKVKKRAKAKAAKGALPEKIDDPVRMYLTQMGEIPLLTRPEEIFLAKSIEITRKRFRKKCMGSGICMTETIATLREVRDGNLAFDRTLKVNPSPKPDDDPKIV